MNLNTHRPRWSKQSIYLPLLLIWLCPLSAIAVTDATTDTDLGVKATDGSGKSVSITTTFTGGISVNKGEQQRVANLKLTDTVEVGGMITVDSKHVKKSAELVVYAGFIPMDSNDSTPSFITCSMARVVFNCGTKIPPI